MNEASLQNIFGFDGDELTFNSRKRMMKMIAKIARNVVDIFKIPVHDTITLNFTPDRSTV